MLQEVLHRRFKNINSAKDKSFSKIPNLIVIDGGKGQLSSVEKALEGLELKLNIVGLAKKLEEVFFLKPNGQFGRVILADNSEAKFLLQRVRDEAHRFAITYHRNLRSKELTQSLLDKIEGIGPAKKRKLIQKFGTIENIKDAETDDIAPVVGRNLAEKIKREL
jgi:excinuclease ABC subunit C